MYCQVPIIYQLGDKEQIEVVFNQGDSQYINALGLGKEFSTMLFQRTGQIDCINVLITK